MSNYNEPEDFYNLSETEQDVLTTWIHEKLDMKKSINYHHSSYGLKHRFEDDINGFYIHNGQFKGAMLECGFGVGNKKLMNWNFNVSDRSVNVLYR